MPNICVDTNLWVYALDLRLAHQLSYWDSLVVAAAIEAGCDTLLSEDMQHGQTLQGIRLVNPLL